MPIRPAVMALAAFLGACAARNADSGAPVTREQIAALMERYQVAARTVDPDSMAAFYSGTAVLFEPGIPPIRSRDSIRAFLASFPGATVHVATAEPDTIELHGGMALYWGEYHERLDFPGQPTSDQRGKFVAQWVRQPDGGWLIERMYRIPLPAPREAAP